MSLSRARACWQGVRLLRSSAAHPAPSQNLRSCAVSPIHALGFSPRFSACPPFRSFTAGPGAPTSSVIVVKSDTEYVSALNLAQENNGLAIIYFTAKWCGPCKMISPIVDELSIKYGKATFLKVDIDEEKLQDMVSEEKITSVPTFRYFQGGKSVGELIGADVRSLKEKVAALCGK